MPEGTLRTFADHGQIGEPLSADGGDCGAVIARHANSGIDVDVLAARLQHEDAKAFAKSWNRLIAVIDGKSEAFDTATWVGRVHRRAGGRSAREGYESRRQPYSGSRRTGSEKDFCPDVLPPKRSRCWDIGPEEPCAPGYPRSGGRGR
jgi:hypothetical protein